MINIESSIGGNGRENERSFVEEQTKGKLEEMHKELARIEKLANQARRTLGGTAVEARPKAMATLLQGMTIRDIGPVIADLRSDNPTMINAAMFLPLLSSTENDMALRSVRAMQGVLAHELSGILPEKQAAASLRNYTEGVRRMLTVLPLTDLMLQARLAALQGDGLLSILEGLEAFPEVRTAFIKHLQEAAKILATAPAGESAEQAGRRKRLVDVVSGSPSAIENGIRKLQEERKKNQGQ